MNNLYQFYHQNLFVLSHIFQTFHFLELYQLYTEPFVIASQNIDIKSLQVFVKQSENDSNPIEYTRAITLADTTTTSQTYFIRGIYDNQYAIEFGDGVFGAPVSNGNIVLIRYRNTDGEIIQGNYQMTKTSAISGYNDVVVNSASIS